MTLPAGSSTSRQNYVQFTANERKVLKNLYKHPADSDFAIKTAEKRYQSLTHDIISTTDSLEGLFNNKQHWQKLAKTHQLLTAFKQIRRKFTR
jgi:hypothetical protein